MYVQAIVQSIREVLDDAAAQNAVKEIRTQDWKRIIGSGIANRINGQVPNLVSCATGCPDGCDYGEWLFDYCTVIVDPALKDYERFTSARAFLVGEIEWQTAKAEIDWDFGKLLLADSRVCFFAFQQYTEPAAIRHLDRLAAAASGRRSRLREDGAREPPAFLLSCYGIREGKFFHREII